MNLKGSVLRSRGIYTLANFDLLVGVGVLVKGGVLVLNVAGVEIGSHNVTLDGNDRLQRINKRSGMVMPTYMIK